MIPCIDLGFTLSRLEGKCQVLDPHVDDRFTICEEAWAGPIVTDVGLCPRWSVPEAQEAQSAELDATAEALLPNCRLCKPSNGLIIIPGVYVRNCHMFCDICVPWIVSLRARGTPV